MIAFATVRADIANYVSAVFYVYIILIFLYVLLNLLFSTGVRPPYARWSDSVLKFLRDVSEPYLRIFRRFIPNVGMFDFSPMIGIIVLWLLRTVIVSAIAG
ncbi:MAG TPA: YggT family protein [Solirubrobacteraceae bacterium]|jgi:YggT family protein|nr:YggT family protein [Solirubrobacteraceae bacterium]